MNSKVVGYVKSVQGLIVKRDVVLGKEETLKVGDLIYIGDSIWARSLDAKSKLALHKKDIELNAGMRITLDEDFLRQNGSYEFFTQDEVDAITGGGKRFDFQLDTEFDTSKFLFSGLIDIEREKNSENYESLEIDYKFISYKKELIFKIYCDDNIDIKSYLVGSSGHILEKPVELNSQIITKDGNRYFIIKNVFVKSNSYLLYLNILNTKNKSIHKEVFCEVDVRL